LLVYYVIYYWIILKYFDKFQKKMSFYKQFILNVNINYFDKILILTGKQHKKIIAKFVFIMSFNTDKLLIR